MSNGGMFRVDWLSDMTPKEYLEHRLQQVGLSELKIHSVVREISAEWGWEWILREHLPSKPSNLGGYHFLSEHTDDTITVSLVEILETAVCHHGCTKAVRLTNLRLQQTWVICLLTFERMAIESLLLMD